MVYISQGARRIDYHSLKATPKMHMNHLRSRKGAAALLLALLVQFAACHPSSELRAWHSGCRGRPVGGGAAAISHLHP